jgi:HSP20 family protein
MFGYATDFEHDLLDRFDRMRREMDRLLGYPLGAAGIRSMAGGGFPAVNVGASADRVDVYLFAAGVDPKGLDISLQQNLLTVAGERNVDLPEKVQVYRSERAGGAFRRVITLPEDVDPDRVSATYRDGVLHITVQRHEALKPRRIEVQ